MKRYPNLKGRYQGSVLSPLQWGVLAAIGYALVMGMQVDSLLHTSFRLELFDHEVMWVEHEARPDPVRRGVIMQGLRPVLDVTPLDWPAPPVQTKWAPASETKIGIQEVRVTRQNNNDGSRAFSQ